jgi:ribonuclease P protein component
MHGPNNIGAGASGRGQGPDSLRRASEPPSRPSSQRRTAREADVSTEQAGAQAPSRFSCPHGNQRRAQGGCRAPRAWTQAAQRLSSAGGAACGVAVERLRNRADFVAAAAGSKVPTAAFVLQARKRSDSGPVRIGFTVSRAVGGAVERNRVRRRLKEIVRLSAATGLSCGHDYVLIGRRAALSLPFEQISEDFKRALRRLRVPK